MIKVAILITCFNRREKTTSCLKNIRQLAKPEGTEIKVFVVDGGSNDGTLQDINDNYPEVVTQVCDGLFWAGGMRKAWNIASQTDDFDFFWLVNDDTFLYKDSLIRLLAAHDYSYKTYQTWGIYTGCTCDPKTRKLTYGAKKLRRPNHLKGDLLHVSNKYQECDLCNGNSLLVPREVYKQIGGLSPQYTHGIADWEYSLKAKRAGFKCLLIPQFVGECERDHGKGWLPQSAPLKERFKYMKSIKGLSYDEFLSFVKDYFPKDYYPMKMKFWGKTLFPFFWDLFKK